MILIKWGLNPHRDIPPRLEVGIFPMGNASPLRIKSPWGFARDCSREEIPSKTQWGFVISCAISFQVGGYIL